MLPRIGIGIWLKIIYVNRWMEFISSNNFLFAKARKKFNKESEAKEILFKV